MPGSLSVATVSPPSTVLPYNLSLSFTRSGVYPMLTQEYHDGTIQSSLITDTVNTPRPVRMWKLTWRLTTAQLATLLTFYETTVQGGLTPFYFYDPFDVSGTPIGGNYDPTGVNTQGRVVVFFRGGWKQTTEIGLSAVPDIMLVEVAYLICQTQWEGSLSPPSPLQALPFHSSSPAIPPAPITRMA